MWQEQVHMMTDFFVTLSHILVTGCRRIIIELSKKKTTSEKN